MRPYRILLQANSRLVRALLVLRLLALRGHHHDRGIAERDVLDALEALWRPILGRG